MKQVIWQTGLRVIKQVLDWFQDGAQDTDRTRRQDYSDAGIFVDTISTFLTGSVTFTNGSSTVSGVGTAFLSELKPGDTITDASGIVTGTVNAVTTNTSLTLLGNWTGVTSTTSSAQRIDSQFEIVIGDNNTAPSPTINVRAGVGYDANGERVVITSPIFIYNASNPTATSSDGIGGTVVTPLSTGSVNIPLTTNTLNYVWLDYINITDTSVFTIQKSSGKKQYYKADDGFKISVTTTSTPPLSSSLLLGTINLTGAGVVSPSTISLSGRSLAGLKFDRAKVQTAKADRSNATAVYSPDTEIFVDAHIKAIGTGTVSALNPHGLTPADIGLNTQEILETHQKFMHSSGIVGSTSSVTSSLYLTPTIITPGEDFVTIEPLTSSEIALVNGITVTSADIPNPVVLLFSSSVDATGTYWVYLDKTTKTIQRTNVDPTSDATKLTIWSFTWTADPFGTPQNGNITAIVDLRVFGTLDNANMNHEDTYTFKILELENGTASIPSLSFQSDPDTGIYRSASGVLSFTSNGVLSANISGGQISALDGTVSLPSYSFLTNTNTGIYKGGTNIIGFASNGNATCAMGDYVSAVRSGFSSVDGSALTPSLTFSSDSDTGIYRSASGVLSFTSNGTLSASISGGQVAAVDGSAGTPAYGFLSDPDTGLYHVSANTFGATAGGTLKWFTDTTGLSINSGAIFNLNGSASTPVYTFTSDTNTGLYRIGSAQLGITAGGTQAANFGTNTTTLLAGGANKLQVNTTNVTSLTNFLNIDGTVSAPAYSYTNETGLGWFRNGSNNVSFASAGSTRAQFSSSGITLQPSSSVSISPNGSNCSVTFDGTSGQTVMTTQSAFTATGSTVGSATGDGTLFTFPSFSNLTVGGSYNRHNDMNYSNGIYTTPHEGIYMLSASVRFTGFAAGHIDNLITIQFATTGSDGTHGITGAASQTYVRTTSDIVLNAHVIAAITSGAQVFLQVQANGPSKVVGVQVNHYGGAFIG